MMQAPTLESFAQYLNSKFLMQVGEAETLEIEMISATDVGSSARQTQFSLVFLAPEMAPLRQGMYQLKHEQLGELTIFLVPIAKDEQGVRYEAIFNRLVKQEAK